LFRSIGGRAVITYTLKAFAEHERIDTVVVAIHPDDEAFFEAARRGIVGDIRAVHGGATRQESVRLALEALHDAAPDLVLIHDAVRPFVDGELIERVVSTAAKGVGALPAL